MPIGSNGQVTVDVGVKLQVLQSSVNELQKVLDRLQPNSSGFKALSKIIGDARKEMERLQVQTSKPFTNQSQFSQAGKTIGKIEDSLERAKLAIDRIDFSDLKLTKEQQDQFNNLKQQITDTKSALDAFKNQKKLELFENTDFKKIIEEIDPKLVEKTFDEVSQAVENKSNEIQKKISELTNKINLASQEIKVGENAKNFSGFLNGDQVKEEFQKFLYLTKDGVLKFKPKQQEAFFDYLKEQFSLNDAQINDLKKKSAGAVEEVLSGEGFFTTQLKKAENAQKRQTSYQSQMTNLKADAEAMAAATNLTAKAEEEISDKSKTTEQTIEELRARIQALEEQLTQTAKTAPHVGEAFNSSTAELESFKRQLGEVNAQFIQLQQRRRTFESIKQGIVNFMGFNQVLNITRNAVRAAINHIKELDTTMNGIAIVTDMTTADLWKQVDAYSAMAQTFGVTIQGAYEVSKIYYQAGYDTNEVLTLTNETLKLSKISGLDYATTTDYMMTAMRGFKLEMEDASRVVDVYSNLAANTAVSQQELAEAMTRTASSMQSVGATFEDTSAMIATMVAVTRESASNIGSAMKSIASRYGELTKDPTKLVDEDGEAMAFNKVDAALQSVGISMKTVDGQFRDFTSVIVELAEKWDTLDSVSQRYIATQFAGNRQQSRFLALVSNIDLLKENMANAKNSEDIGTLQALKAMDSLESKINQVQVAYQQFYTTIGAEEVWKGFLDGAKNVINTLNDMPKLFGKIPISAIATVSIIVDTIRTLLSNWFVNIVQKISTSIDTINNQVKEQAAQGAEQTGQTILDIIEKILTQGKQKISQGASEAAKSAANAAKNTSLGPENIENQTRGVKAFFSEMITSGTKANKTMSTLGGTFTLVSTLINTSTNAGQAFSGVLATVGGAIRVLTAAGASNPFVAVATGLLAAASGIKTFIDGMTTSTEELKEQAEELNNVAKEAKANYNTLKRSIDQYQTLEKKRYESAESAEAYQDAVEELAEKFPQLIDGINDAGEVTINANNIELELAKAREQTANATYEALRAEQKAKVEELRKLKNNTEGKTLAKNIHNTGLLTNFEGASETYGLEEVYNNLLESVENLKEIKDLNSKEGEDALNKLKQSINEFVSERNQKLEDNLSPEEFKEFGYVSVLDIYDQLGLTEYFSTLKEIEEKEQQLAGITKAEAAAWIRSDWVSQQTEKQQELFEAFNGTSLSQIAASELQSKYNEARKNNSKLLFEDWVKTYDEANEFIKNLWDDYSGLDPNIQEKFDDLFKQSSVYTGADIIKELGIEEDGAFAKAILAYYSDTVEGYNEKINETLAHSKLEIDDLGDENKLTKIDWQFISDAAKQADNLFQLSETRFNNYSTAINALYTSLIDAPDLEKLIVENGLNTIEGIEKSIKQLDENDTEQAKIIKALNDLKAALYTNIYLTASNLTDEVLSDWKDNASDITGVRSGVSFDKAREFIQKAKALGLGEADIEYFQSGDKIIIAEETYQKYLQTYYQNKEAQAEELATTARNAAEWFKDNSHKNIKREATNKYIENILGTDEAVKFLTNENFVNGNFITNEGIKYLQEKAQIAVEAANEATEWVSRTYDAAKRASDYAIGNYQKDFDTLEKIASNKQLAVTDLDGQEIQKSLNNAYSSLISDALSLGLENINLAHYQGLIAEDESNLQALIDAGDIEGLINNYYLLAGKTLEEKNALIVQTIEKQTESTSGAAQEALRQVDFYTKDIAYASLDTIKKLADAMHVNIEQIKGDYDAGLDQYVVKDAGKWAALITNSTDILFDSINSVINSITKYINSGLSGKLQGKDITNLNSQLKAYGIEELTTADFTQTAEGLKLSEQAAIHLYSELRKIDAIQAQITFNDLSKSLQENNEHYKDAATILIRIEELTQKIKDAESKDNTTRANQYREELALAKQIAAVRLGTEDKSFKFMDNNLPSVLQNQVDAIDAYGKMFKSINTASKEGRMDVQDFYNIVNQLNSLADLSNQSILFAGYELNGDLTKVAELIEDGFHAIDNVDGEGAKINFSKMANGFVKGADLLEGDITAGVKVIADSQIQMLDAMIQMLETVVAMEELGDIDIEGNGIDFKELFGEEDLTKSSYEATEEARKALNNILELAKTDEKLKEALNKFKINGESLADIFTKLASGQEVSNDEAQIYFAAIRALYEMARNGNYDLENLVQSISQVASESGLLGEFDLGEIKINFRYGKSATSSDGINWEYNGQSYTNADKDKMYQQMAKDALGVEVGEKYSFENGIASKNINLESDVKIAVKQDGKLRYVDSENREFDSLSDLIKANKKDGETEAEAATRMNILTEWKSTLDDGEKFAADVGQAHKDSIDEYKTVVSSLIDSWAEKGQAFIRDFAGVLNGKKIENTSGGKDNSPVATLKTQNQPTSTLPDKAVMRATVAQYKKDKEAIAAAQAEAEAAKAAAAKVEADANAKVEAAQAQVAETEAAMHKDLDAAILRAENAEFALAQIEKRIERLETQKEKLEEQLNNAAIKEEQDLLTYKAQEADFNNTRDSLLNQLEELRGELNAANEAVEAARAEVEAANNAKEQAEKDKENYREANSNQAAEMNSLLEENTALKGQNAEQLLAIDDLNNTINSKIKEIAELNKIIEANESEIAELKQAQEDWYKKEQDYDQMVTSLDQQLEFSKKDAIAEQKRLQVRIDELTAENSRLQFIVQDLQNRARQAIPETMEKPNSELIDFGSKSEENAESESVQIEAIEKEVIAQGLAKLSAAQPALLHSLLQAAEDAARKKEEDTLAGIEQVDTNGNDVSMESFYDFTAEELQAIITRLEAISTNWKDDIEYFGLDNFIARNKSVLTDSVEKWLQLSYGTQGNNVNSSSQNTTPVEDIKTASEELGESAEKLEESAQATEESAEVSKEAIIAQLEALKAEREAIQQQLDSIINNPQTRNEMLTNPEKAKEVGLQTLGAKGQLKELEDKIAELEAQLTEEQEVDVDTDKASKNMDHLKKETDQALIAVKTLDDESVYIPVSSNATTVTQELYELKKAANEANEAVNEAVTAASAAQNRGENIIHSTSFEGQGGRAKGNVALAKGRQTLMGELGPELVVSNGRYFVAGQNGAEFVNLADDAIVFNHLQTKRLLQSGSAGHGKAVVSDKKAVSLATGNTQGPAMASASAALAELKKIRAMWSALLDASISDLGSKAGLGKSGGGGGKDKDKALKLDAGYIKDLEKWYNLLRQIERLEEDINYEEKLRSKHMADTVSHGKEIYESYKREYDMLQKEVDRRVELAELKKGYYEQKMQETQEGPWGQLFTFDENGTVQMREGSLEFLAKVFGSDETGAALHSARQQYAMLQEAGFGQLMQYKDDGSRIEWTDDEGKPREEAYKEAVEAFSSHMDAYSDELQSLREEYTSEMEAILDTQIKQNEILQEIRDNQIAVEEEVMKAIVDSREREIDELKKQRDALADSTDAFIEGLNDQLNKEREMYDQQQNNAELTQMQRQLAILQRSGGSASQIRSLQKQISQRQKEAYFDAQSKAIDAIKEASDRQLQKLDEQIQLMEETLAYEQDHGLLWDKVYEVMNLSEEEIANFITSNQDEWLGKSPAQKEKDLTDLDNKISLWVASKTDISDLGKTMSNALTNGIKAITSVTATRTPYEALPATGDWNPDIPNSKSSGGGGTGGSGTSGTRSTSTATRSSSNRSSSNNSSNNWVVDNGDISTTTTLDASLAKAAQQEHGYSFIFNGSQYSGSRFSSRAEAQSAAEMRISALASSYPGTVGEQFKRGARSTLSVYKKGGIIDYTGPAWVDGTKKRPEGVLSAEQLNMLRNMVLTPKNPLTGLLSDLSNSLGNTASSDTYNSINTNGAIIIENASVNMNVQKISNDYDTKRAMDTAMERMVEIARKSSTTSVRR